MNKNKRFLKKEIVSGSQGYENINPFPAKEFVPLLQLLQKAESQKGSANQHPSHRTL